MLAGRLMVVVPTQEMATTARETVPRALRGAGRMRDLLWPWVLKARSPQWPDQRTKDSSDE